MIHRPSLAEAHLVRRVQRSSRLGIFCRSQFSCCDREDGPRWHVPRGSSALAAWPRDVVVLCWDYLCPRGSCGECCRHDAIVLALSAGLGASSLRAVLASRFFRPEDVLWSVLSHRDSQLTSLTAACGLLWPEVRTNFPADVEGVARFRPRSAPPSTVVFVGAQRYLYEFGLPPSSILLDDLDKRMLFFERPSGKEDLWATFQNWVLLFYGKSEASLRMLLGDKHPRSFARKVRSRISRGEEEPLRWLRQLVRRPRGPGQPPSLSARGPAKRVPAPSHRFRVQPAGSTQASRRAAAGGLRRRRSGRIVQPRSRR